MSQEILTTVSYNGLCNRLMNILGCYRLALKTGRICNVVDILYSENIKRLIFIDNFVIKKFKFVFRPSSAP
jgi:hypothetical protein